MRASPWLRLTGALLVGLAVVDIAVEAAIPWLLRRMRDPEQASSSSDTLEEIAVDASVSIGLMEAVAVAGVLVLFVVHARGSIRIPAALASAATLFGAAPLVAMIMYRANAQSVDTSTLHAWFDYAAAARLVAVVGLAAIVLQHAPRGRARAVAIASMTVGVAATIFVALIGLTDADEWWQEMLGPVRLPSFVWMVAGLGKGLAVWLAAAPCDDEGLDAASARGLRLARTGVWLWVVAALATTSIMIAGSIAPWLAYLEIAVATLVWVGLAAVVVQRREAAASLFVALGVALIMIAAALSFGLSVALHGDPLQRFTDLSELVAPLQHGGGSLGTACVLVGLAMLAHRTGHPPPKRLLRFVTLCAVVALIWLYRDPIDELGDVAFMFIPVVLAAIVWAIVELTRYLGEVADGLERRG